MGQVASVGLTQYDVEEVIACCNNCFTQREVEGLYRRFRNVDRGRKGYISVDEFLAIPELSINPLAARLVRLFESVNFRDFARLLSAFGSRASREEKLTVMFLVFDVDGDGLIGRDDLLIMLRMLAGSSLSEDDLQLLVDQIQDEAMEQKKVLSSQPRATKPASQPGGAALPVAAYSKGSALPGHSTDDRALDFACFKFALRNVDLAHMTVEIPSDL